jgi:hypothetical protein
LMNTFNLMQVTDFPTRIINNSGTLIDTIFVDNTICDKIQVKPIINCLSDHDTQSFVYKMLTLDFSKMSLFFGLPSGHVNISFHLYTLFTILSSGI